MSNSTLSRSSSLSDISSLLDSVGSSDRKWVLKNTRASKSWQTAITKGRGVRIAFPGTVVCPHVGLENNAVLSDLAVNVAAIEACTAVSELQSQNTALVTVMVGRQVGEFAGCAPAAHVVPFICDHDNEMIEAEDLAKAIDQAASRECKIICVARPVKVNANLLAAVKNAVANNTIIIVASGDVDQEIGSLADLEDVVTVCGSSASDRPWIGSASGMQIDFAAPASNVWSASPDERNRSVADYGTAFAAAVSSGIAALWLGHHGSKELEGVADGIGVSLQTLFLNAVKATTRQPNSWDRKNYGSGIIDADALIRLKLENIDL